MAIGHLPRLLRRLRAGSFWRDYLHGNGRDHDCELDRVCHHVHDDAFDRCHSHGMKIEIGLSILTCSLPLIDVTSIIIDHAQSATRACQLFLIIYLLS